MEESQEDQSTQESATPAAAKRWNLRERRAPVQRLDSSADSVHELEVVNRKRKAPDTRTPVAKRKAQKNTAQKVTSDEEEDDMFSVVFAGKSAMQSVASEWADRYKEAPEKAMVELVQYFVLCCGCRATITMEMFQNEDTTSVIRSLTENFDEESGDYPLIATGPMYKKFKSSFSELLEHVVEQCQHSILFDEYMLDTLIIWLVGFTDSQVRAFRHTCTLACMKLVTALVHVANTVSSELDNTQRQIDAEKKRQQTKKGAAGKLEKLMTKRSELQRRNTELGDTMQGVFLSVFVHRYRDVRPEIRSLCLSELGVWMMEYRAHFLADSYLKYAGWCLYDKVGEVRLASVGLLESLYSSEETAPHLELFTQRFKDRLLSMRLDKEDAVCVKAIHLLSHLLSLDLLEPEECVEVCELMFVESRSVSHTAGEFATRYLFSEDFMTRAKQAKVPKGHKKPTDSQIQLVELVRFFLEVNIHQHATYFVDSLWDAAAVLKEWDEMISLLLDDKAGILLSGEEEASLIEILACSVRRAVGSGMPPARTKGKVLTNKERRAVEEERVSLSTALMVALPDLISKFGSVAEQASNLAHIPQTFDLELYAEHRLQKHLESLLKHLHQLVTKHVDSSTLDEAARTFLHLCNTDFSLHSTAEVAFTQLVDELVQTLNTHLDACHDQSMTEDDSEEVIGLAVSLERIVAFNKVMDLSRWKLPGLIASLQELATEGQLQDRVACCLVSALRLDLQWGLANLDDATPSREGLRELQSRLTPGLQFFRDLLMRGRGVVTREAYMTLCDLLVVFGRQLRSRGNLSALVYTPDSGLQQAMQEYVLEEVIDGGEDSEDSEPSSEAEAVAIAERLNDRRVQLAGFLKLVLFGVLEMKVAAPVFAQYVRHYHHFGDLLKLSLARCREAQPTQWYKTIALSLQQVFLHLVEEGGGQVDLTDPRWADLRDLARRYSLPFSFDQVKPASRQMLVGIHREGINFALSHPEEWTMTSGSSPPYLNFLTVLGEFSNRLLEVDKTGKKGVLVYLQEKLSDGAWEVGRDGWAPLHAFRNMLAGGEGSVDGRSARAKGKTKKRPQRVVSGEVEEWMTTRPAKNQRTTSPHEP